MLELFGDSIKYVIIENRLVEALEMKKQKCQNVKIQTYIASVGPNTRQKCDSQYNGD